MSGFGRRGGDEPVPIGDALAEVGSELGLPDPAVLAVLHTRWTELVGENAARHARLRSLREGVLLVAVDAPQWATQLRYLEPDVLRQSAALVGPGTVRKMRLIVDPDAAKTGPETP
jgi:predicted nucleic acid-binding Zn ribbon protein